MKRLIKYYAVAKGVRPGIYTSWEEAKPNIYKFKGALYKSFFDETDAIAWFEANIPSRNDAGRPNVTVYTEAVCPNGVGPGAYGVALHCGEHTKKIAKGYRFTTFLRLELQAAISALRALHHISNVTLNSSSRYIVDLVNSGQINKLRDDKWKGPMGPLENADLLQPFFYLTKKHFVCAKNTNTGNLDQLCQATLNKGAPLVDAVSEVLQGAAL